MDFEAALAMLEEEEEDTGIRPAMTPRVAMAVDLPADEEDAAAAREAPLANAADSLEVFLPP